MKIIYYLSIISQECQYRCYDTLIYFNTFYLIFMYEHRLNIFITFKNIRKLNRIVLHKEKYILLSNIREYVIKDNKKTTY